MQIVHDPFIGQFGQHRHVDVVQRGLEQGLLAVQFLISVILREGHHNVKGLAGGVAHDLILKIIDEGAAAQRQVVTAAAGITALKFHAVNGTHIINVDGIPAFGGPFGLLLGGGVVAQHVVGDVLTDLLRADDLRISGQGQMLEILRQRHVIQRGHALEIAFLVKDRAVIEVCQIRVGILRVRPGDGFFGGGLFCGLGAGFGGAAAAGQRGANRQRQQQTGGTFQLQFHGNLLFRIINTQMLFYYTRLF